MLSTPWSTSGAADVGVGEPELQAASRSEAATAATNPNGRCRPRFPRMAASMTPAGGAIR